MKAIRIIFYFMAAGSGAMATFGWVMDNDLVMYSFILVWAIVMFLLVYSQVITRKYK